MKQRLKQDRYRKARGGWARLLKISCAACGGELLTYQKDGAGPLKRLYLDRIFAPATLTGLEHAPLKRVPKLTCPRCNAIIGMPYCYDKEPRNAFRIMRASFVKKIVKLK